MHFRCVLTVFASINFWFFAFIIEPCLAGINDKPSKGIILKKRKSEKKSNAKVDPSQQKIDAYFIPVKKANKQDHFSLSEPDVHDIDREIFSTFSELRRLDDEKDLHSLSVERPSTKFPKQQLLANNDYEQSNQKILLQDKEIENNDEPSLDFDMSTLFSDDKPPSFKPLETKVQANASDPSSQLSLSFDEDDPPHQRQRLKKKPPDIAELKNIATSDIRKYPIALSTFDYKDDSDEDDLSHQNTLDYDKRFSNIPEEIAEMGVLIKLLANVYLRRIDQTGNVFLPYYTYKIYDSLSAKEDNGFFRTPKNEICVFVSGGLQNAWEKTVARVYEIFFKQKIKIIRASWVEKHLYSEKHINLNLAENFKGREHELHSEYYYDLFFNHFFLPKLPKAAYGKESTLAIHCFSWWEVCNDCEKLLTIHSKDLLGNHIKLIYEVAACRRYFHKYPAISAVKTACSVSQNYEQISWKQIWKKVLFYAEQSYKSERIKEKFWTTAWEGLEICKWLGQAFVENSISLSAKKTKPLKRGDVLQFYADANKTEVQSVENLLKYLRDVNWELSCWYKPNKYPEQIQKRWKNYWRGVVMPHFGWEEVFNFDEQGEGGTGFCEMCGYENIQHISLVFHPKFRVSRSFLDMPQKDQEMSASEYFLEKNAQALPAPIMSKRKQSLCVGSECVKHLSLTAEDLERWREENPDAKVNKNLEDLARREEELDQLEKAEKEISQREKNKKRSKKKIQKKKKNR